MWERPGAVRTQPLDGSALCAAHAQPLLSPGTAREGGSTASPGTLQRHSQGGLG